MTGAKPYGQLRYREISGKRMAYVDEGHDPQGWTIVFQHGNPTSSYLWRNIMPHLEGLGRLVASDLIGMGGSDKLDNSGPDRYHYAEQRDYLFGLWDALELGDRVVLVLHDWGSALGFDWANQHRDRVRGIAHMETIAMPIDWSDFPGPVREVFGGFRSPQGERCAQAARQRRTRRPGARPGPRLRAVVAQPDRGHRCGFALHPGGQSRRNRHGAGGIRPRPACQGLKLSRRAGAAPSLLAGKVLHCLP
jgi:pimeloyl-ACP methyl ester carboxylesterase